MIWRNVHSPPLSELDLLFRDARTFSGALFHLIYGPSVWRSRGPDNSIRVSTAWREPIVKPYVLRKGSHKTPPRAKDVVKVISDDAELFGSITYIDRDSDAVGVFLFKDKTLETFSYDCLESNPGRVRWRIIQ